MGYYSIKSSDGKFCLIKYIENTYQLEFFKRYAQVSYSPTCKVVAVQITEKT